MDHSPRFLKMIEDARPTVRELSVADVLGKLGRQESFELVDVREDSEWSAGRIAGSRHLGRGVLERDIEAAIPDLDREVVLYCGGGFRSVLAAISLRQMGYRNVASMAGGWREWKAAKGPIE